MLTEQDMAGDYIGYICEIEHGRNMDSQSSVEPMFIYQLRVSESVHVLLKCDIYSRFYYI